MFPVAPHFMGFPFFAPNILFPPEPFDVLFSEGMMRNTQPRGYDSPVSLRYPCNLLAHTPRFSVYLVVKLRSWQRLLDLISQLHMVNFKKQSRRA